MKYVYPAIFTPEDGGYLARFPDIEGCYTDGDTLAEAIETARDALSLMLCGMEDRGTELPNPSEMKNIATENEEFVSLIEADTTAYRKKRTI